LGQWPRCSLRARFLRIFDVLICLAMGSHAVHRRSRDQTRKYAGSFYYPWQNALHRHSGRI